MAEHREITFDYSFSIYMRSIRHWPGTVWVFCT